MPERPRFSRFRRLPGLFRTGDAKLPDPNEEPVPVTVYLPARVLDLAENLAARSGAANVQEYCEHLLREAIENEDESVKQEAVAVTHGTFESLDDLANDPEYLTEWSSSAREPQADQAVRFLDQPEPASGNAMDELRATIDRHAGLGPDPNAGVLPTLRRGEILEPELADELISALTQLETQLQGAQVLDRKLAYTLHRLAFEGQVLLTDTPTEAGRDPGSIERMRRIQESVDRVLSGEDIRYYTESASPELQS